MKARSGRCARWRRRPPPLRRAQARRQSRRSRGRARLSTMHDLRWIRDNRQAFDPGLTRRGLTPQAARLLAIDEGRRSVIHKLETAQARRNAASKEIGQAKSKRDEATAQALMAEVTELKVAIAELEVEERAISKKLDD